MNIKEKILDALNNENKEKAVSLSINALQDKKLDIIKLYNILTEALHNIDCDNNEFECIYKEHIKSAIVRTIIESSYIYLLEESKTVNKRNEKVIVVCPKEEYHEIGAKIASDFFVLNGFESIFIGANSPDETILEAINYIKPTYIALSVTNVYNMFQANKLVNKIKDRYPEVKILGGGQAFSNKDSNTEIKVDYIINSFEDISKL